MTIVECFHEAECQAAALQAYERFSVSANWPIPELFCSYAASRPAFESSTSRSDALRVFTAEVYENLRRYWMVFRSSSTGQYWPSERVFDSLKDNFADLGWNTNITLANVPTIISAQEMVLRLEALRDIKPNKGYPIMAASKFLHFFNPRLFPIYDNEIVWERVMKLFRNDFKTYCISAGLPYDMTDSAVFLRNYIWWASSLVAGAHPEFMSVFSRWAEENSNEILSPNDLSLLYATAFEFAVIGAERIENARLAPVRP